MADERLAVRLLDTLGDEAGLAEKQTFSSPVKGWIVVGREPWPERQQRQS